MTQYSYTYKRREMTESEIQQAGADQAELEAAKKAVVNFYRDENTGEILTICQICFQDATLQDFVSDLTYVDKAGEWDICGYCDAQNIPTYYHEPDAGLWGEYQHIKAQWANRPEADY